MSTSAPGPHEHELAKRHARPAAPGRSPGWAAWLSEYIASYILLTMRHRPPSPTFVASAAYRAGTAMAPNRLRLRMLVPAAGADRAGGACGVYGRLS